MSVRRSGRRRNPVAFEPDSCYPDAPPCTEFERIVAKLDLEAFPSSNFARIDDVLTYALFATKRSPRNYRALVPTRAFLDGNPPLTKAEALDINNFYVSIRDCPATLTVAAQLTKYLKDKYPSIIMDGTDERAAKHLVSRYHLLHQRPESPLALEKVRFNVGGAGTITCGLKATRFIPVASFLLSAGGSMSSDLVQGKPAISIIESSMQQKGPHGPRLLLGPFRFANHDCKPNCQIMPIPSTHAYTLCSIRPIYPEDSITVSYAKDGSYFMGGTCGCASCNPENPPIAPKREANYVCKKRRNEDQDSEGRVSKKRRGGERARKKRQHLSVAQSDK